VTSLGLALLLEVSVLVPGTDTYAAAYRETTKTGRPMVVFVGAEWCGPCQTMKREVIPQIRRRCLRGRVAFAMVNMDRERELARRLTRGGPIPQLLMFRRARDGWRLSRLKGGQTVGTVEAFIDGGLQRDAAAKEAETGQQLEPPEETATAQENESARQSPSISNS
jgi:thioredoxin-like negative regulator of GroEL